MKQAIAIDIGTSGIRGQLLDLEKKKVLRTCVTQRNPIPGANVMDHMSFAIDYGKNAAHAILLSAVKSVTEKLSPGDLERIAVCGNPIQLSLFENIEIKDLAYAGNNKLVNDKIEVQDRKGHIAEGDGLGFPGVDIVVPPSVKHEIGADALAMMLKSGFLDDDMCMVTDYGTNAEMALKVGENIYTGSAAAGPALEGQQIRCGMLAGPGAISDMERTPQGWQTKVLDDSLIAADGPIVNIRSNICRNSGVNPSGITGTGVIAIMHAMFQDDKIDESKMCGGPVRITRTIDFNETDYKEAGKAVGAIRAGHITLMYKAGIDPSEVKTMYMAGASGTYVDPIKARAVGMIIPTCKKVVQVGNTSLELAKDLAFNPGMLKDLEELRGKLLTEHTMFASSDVFSDLYLYEFGYWNDGMPIGRYRRALERYGFGDYLDVSGDFAIEKRCERDIREIGEKLEIVDTGTSMSASWGCSKCMKCVDGCPEKALSFDDKTFTVLTERCLGTACRKCEENCPESKFRYSAFIG